MRRTAVGETDDGSKTVAGAAVTDGTVDVKPADEADTNDDSDDGGDADYELDVTPTTSDDRENRDLADRTIAVEPATDPIGGPEYVLFGGKGGVGKTTMAAATALDSARSGLRTLVVSTDPAHSLSDVFDRDVPSRPEPIHEELPLFGVEIDPSARFDAMRAEMGRDDETGGTSAGTDGTSPGGAQEPSDTTHTEDTDRPFDEQTTDPFGGDGPFGDADEQFGAFGDLLGMGEDAPVEGLLGGTTPGADEAAALQILLEYLDDDRFERVVIDTAPTGHTLRLLELPEFMDTMMGRIIRLRERISGMMEGVAGLFGSGQPDHAGGESLDDLRAKIERLRAVLTDPERTDFRIVLVPEEMSVIESKRLRERLNEFDIPVDTVIVNRIMEPLDDVTEAVDGDFLQPNLDECAFCARRWSVQQQALAEAQELFLGTTVKRVPLFADEVRGEAMLDVVAACLR